jgi:hypothetical protein
VHEEKLVTLLPFSTRNPALTAPSITFILFGEDPTTIVVEGTAKYGVSEFREHN